MINHINAIVCVSRNWAIGKNNKLLFNIKEDMNFFKNKTKGVTVVMGYNTLLSLPGSKPLKNRPNIVIAPEGVERTDCVLVHTLDELLAEIDTALYYGDVFIIGGGMLYKSMLPYYHKVYVTMVNEDVEDATVFFPNLDELKNEFTITDLSDMIITESGKEIEFITYERKVTH
jgi:dihydrofolate reductase